MISSGWHSPSQTKLMRCVSIYGNAVAYGGLVTIASNFSFFTDDMSPLMSHRIAFPKSLSYLFILCAPSMDDKYLSALFFHASNIPISGNGDILFLIRRSDGSWFE